MNRARVATLIALLMMADATRPAVGGPFEDAGAAYESGDYQGALRLWLPLANQGVGAAQTNVGLMFELGRGVPQNFTEALKWYRLAADQGYASAQTNVGSMYHLGRGVAANNIEAVKWFRLAAEQGYARGQSVLGFMYSRGFGVPQNYILSHMWLNLAGAAGDAVAPQLREFVAGKMTSAQLAEAQRLAAEWKPKR
jgi:TPR repeat protein